jgi:hypothetical protein
MAVTKGVNQGKSEFVRAQITEDPGANHQAVNKAWKAAGKRGSISVSLVTKIRAVQGVTGGKRRAGKATAARGRPGRPPKETHTNGLAKKDRPAGRGRELEALEAEIDGLLFRAMGLGGLAEVEAALRQARRELVRAQRRS